MNINSLLEENEIIVSSISKKEGNLEDYILSLMEGGNENA